MVDNSTSCIKSVYEIHTCIYCSSKLIKAGFSKAKKQRYKCNYCNKTIVDHYTNIACCSKINKQIMLFIGI
ncbi:IS1/IS1595 family N-terminal zinc-binding domain-containing protein [Paenimyroides tangerinum]